MVSSVVLTCSLLLIALGMSAARVAHHQCPIGDFMCASDGDCIPENWRCDEEMDCEDGTDERNCETYVRPQENEDNPNGQVPVHHSNSHRGFHEHRRLHSDDALPRQ
ncbi:hypothetical protein C0Q70_17724 [Pomacea canaliculata]|uniref:Uncharacterized protein n=1 Tax=Pomacea canaliculata TaxID=400727 RepID=A0A2T7NL90_POMCA|nr:hypothetical protein C0Q70_17724 [Pomacea canaliculata]